MRIRKFLLNYAYYIWLICFPALTFAQSGTITGKVIKIGTQNPIERASVFLNNATYGTATQEDGAFTLTGVKPGQYDLVVSSVGYELYSQKVLVSSNATVKLDIQLMPKTTELRDVIITTPEGWKRNYEMFLADFMGETEDAKKCKITNPRDLYLVWHKAKKTLEASSDNFIIIENYAIGYRVKLLLKNFESDKINNLIGWQANMQFEEMQGSATQRKKWIKRRDEIYYGSATHFLRSLLANQLDNEGFEIRTLYRRPNRLRAPEAVIEKKLAKFRYTNLDSARYWTNQYNMSKYDDSLVRRPMNAYDILRKTDQPGIYGITFNSFLYVMYNKRYETVDYRDVYHPLDLPGYETSIASLKSPYALFDLNGTVVSSPSMLYEGSWIKNKGAELLPVDYTPVNSGPVLHN